MIVLASFALHIGHPGIAYGGKKPGFTVDEKEGPSSSTDIEGITMNNQSPHGSS